MKKVLLLFFPIALMLWFSCEEAEDCAGVLGGEAEIDECGVCDEDPANDCMEDCSGEWGGNNICGCTDSTAINYDSTATFDDESCEYDTTPPTVSISSHISGQTVNGIVTIIVTTEDNEGISKVEFYIDDSLVLTDSVSPYEYEWNTEQYENNSEHTVKVISYDNSDNSTESEPIVLVVYYPEVTLWGVVYSIEDTDSLDLQESGLTGPIPPEIGDLINLVYLNLDGSGVTGSIPSEIGNLTNLKYLYLGHNGLTGSIPSEIWNLTNLIEMDLYKFNELTGSIPPEIGNLTDLTYLNLRACGLTGSIPPEIGNLTSLELLWLAHNQLTGSIPPEIGNLTNLTDFQLYGNQLSGIVPDEICNMDISVLTDSYVFDNNQLCPPYPSCIEDGVGEQDTSNCN